VGRHHLDNDHGFYAGGRFGVRQQGACRRHARGFFSLVQIMGQPQGGGQLRQQIGVYGPVLWGGCGMSFSAHVQGDSFGSVIGKILAQAELSGLPPRHFRALPGNPM